MPFRLVPVLVAAAVLSLTVKIGDLWHDLGAVIEPGVGAAQAAQHETGSVPGERTGRSTSEPAQVKEQAKESEEPPAASGQPERWSITPAKGGEAAAAQETDSPAASEPETGDTPSVGVLAPLRDPYDYTDEEISLLQQLSARREQIEQRGRDIEQREALLAAAEARVERKVSELEDLRRTIEELIIQHDEQEEAQLRSLVKIYENMKPKEAARIFEELDMVVLLEVIDRMKERKAAPVLAKMSPDRAKEITLELAQRRDLPVAKE